MKFGLALLAGVFTLAPAMAQESPVGAIYWQVNDRFRFFSEPGYFIPHLKTANAFAAIDAPRDEFGRKKINGEWTGPIQFAERQLADGAIKAGHDGWAAQAYTAARDAFTCWDTGLRRVRPECVQDVDGDGSRLFPRQVEISASVDATSMSVFAGKQCEWFVHTGQDQDWRSVTQVDCAGPATLKVPVNSQFSILARVLDPASADGYLTQITAVYQEVQGKLVLGLGDSYASGEGNPDYPANYSKSLSLADTLRPRPTTLPHWLDYACHRSVYSHQQRIAMQLAAENPRSVVSFLGYACSGADIPDVMQSLASEDEHVEPITASVLAELRVKPKLRNGVIAQSSWSQLDQAVRDLCADKGAATASEPLKRCNAWRARPDLVLLSAGGNDAGFGNVIKWTVAGTAVGKVRLLTGAEPPDTMLKRVQDKEDALDCDNDNPGWQCRFSDRFASLAAAIENRLELTDRSKVVTGPYPGPMGDEQGRVCSAEVVNEGADSEYYVETTDDKLQRLHKVLFAQKHLTNALKAAVGKTGWTWVDSLAWSGAFDSHGVCARGNTGSDAFKSLKIINGEWQPASPSEMLAYAPRRRWFRTFNDSILMQYYVTPIAALARNPRQPIDYHYRAGVSGYFHPTAEGQAVMADMLLGASRCKLFGTQC